MVSGIALFDTIKRVNLERTIDDIINRMPVLMKHIRDPNFKKYYLMLSKEEDFVLGWVIGMIAGHSEVALSAMSGGDLELSDYQELSSMAQNRLMQIRKVIKDHGGI